MLNYSNAKLQNLILHFVGNKTLENELVISDSPTEVSSEHEADVTNFLISAFKNSICHQFTHISDVSLNPLFVYTSKIFDSPNSLVTESKHIAKHLYNISTHAGIKDGELIIGLVNDIYYEDEVVSGIAIIKSEVKNTFLKTSRSKSGISFKVENGISMERIDKGCLILNTNRENGFVVFVIDKTNSGDEALFWSRSFLDIIECNDSYHSTKNFLSLCKTFIKQELPDTKRTEQIDFLNKSVSYFKNNESLDLKNFSNEVFNEPKIIESFSRFKSQNGGDLIQDSFPISSSAVKQQSKVFKSILKLDKNFDIQIHGDKGLIENGFDIDKQMNFYKIYYSKEY